MKRSKPAIYMILAIAAIVVFISVSILPVYREWAFICENTGSRRGHRTWFFGLETRHWYKKSKLEEFIETKYPDTLTHRWTNYAGTGRNAFGISVVHGHGYPGPIMSIPYDSLNLYVTQIDDEKKRALYEIFSSGDKQQIADEISMIVEQVLSF